MQQYPTGQAIDHPVQPSAFSSSASSNQDDGEVAAATPAAISGCRFPLHPDMAVPIIQMLQPHHQAICRSAGPDFATAFASLVRSKNVAIYALPNHKHNEGVCKVDTTTSTATYSSSTVPVPVRLSRLPRPQSTVAYIFDEDTAARESDVLVLPETSSTHFTSSTAGKSVCTSFPAEVSNVADSCRRASPASIIPITCGIHGNNYLAATALAAATDAATLSSVPATSQQLQQKEGGAMGAGIASSGDTPLPLGWQETSNGTLDWLSDQQAASSSSGSQFRKTIADQSGGSSMSVNNGVSSMATEETTSQNVSVFATSFKRNQNLRLRAHILSMAPVAVDSSKISDIHVVVNVEALALRGSGETSPLLTVSTTHRTSRSRISAVKILDGFCSNVGAKSIEFIGMSKVVSIASGFLAGAFVERVNFSPMPRLRSVGDDWMYLCSRLSQVNFAGECDRLKTVGSYWFAECRSLTTFSHRAFGGLEHVGSWWLARCDSLDIVSFKRMQNLRSVGDWWMSSCAGIEKVHFPELSSLARVGCGWLHAAVSLIDVSFSGLTSLRSVGDLWMSDCTWLQSISHSGLRSLRGVGSYWLSGCCILNHVSMTGVNRLSSVGPYWLANTCAPKIECSSDNSNRISTLIDLSHELLTQQGRIDPKTKLRFREAAISSSL